MDPSSSLSPYLSQYLSPHLFSPLLKTHAKTNHVLFSRPFLSAGATSLVKISSIPGIANTSFTDAPIQLVLLGAAESATTIIAASIPILRALVRDTGPDLKTPPAEPRALEGQQQHGTDSESTARLSWNTTRSNSWISSDTDLDKLKNRLSDLSLTGEHGKGLQEGEMVGDYEKYQPSDVGKGI